jgi:Zn-dependent protease
MSQAASKRGPFAGALAALGVALSKGKGLLLLVAKMGKLSLTAWTMLAAAWVYAGRYGWPFACGLVLLTLVHEIGHGLAARRAGLPVSAPVFIPFFGAFVRLGRPRSSWENFVISMAGPIFGATASALCLLAAASASGGVPELLHVLGYYGLVINLFNLVPFGFLDGAHALSPIPWRAGVAAAALAACALFLSARATGHVNPIGLVVVIGAGAKLWWRSRVVYADPSGIPDVATDPQRRIALAVYFGTVTSLTLAVQTLQPHLPSLR